MAVRPLVNIERLTTAHVNSIDGSMTYESGVEYKANTTVSYNGSLYTANVDIEDTDTDTPDEAPDRWSLTINASEAGTAGDISALAARVTALEETVGDETDGLVKDVDDLQDKVNKVDNTWTIMDFNTQITVTADGVKSYKQLLNELATLCISEISSIEDDTILKIDYLMAISKYLKPVVNKLFDNSISSFSDDFRYYSMSANSFTAYTLTVDTSSSDYFKCNMTSTPAIAFDDISNDVPSDGSTFTMHFIKYKKIT